MRQKTKNVQNQGSNDKKNGFFGSVPKSHTQMGMWLSAKNASEKSSCLGTFKINRNFVGKILFTSKMAFLCSDTSLKSLNVSE